MRRTIWFSLLLFLPLLKSSVAAGQACTTYVVVPAFDRVTHDPIENLQAQDFEARMGHASLPVLSANPNFTNRLLVLLEADHAGDQNKVGEMVDLIVRMTRNAPEGKPVAFGIYATKSEFTTGFQADQKERTREINDVIERRSSLGNRVGLYDAMHAALALFSHPQTGDTVLVIGDPVDDHSHHSPGDLINEYTRRGIRVTIMPRQPINHVERDYITNSHTQEKEFFEHIAAMTGGFYTDFKARWFQSPWQGYLLAIQLPDGLSKPKSWNLRVRRSIELPHKANVFYPAKLGPCSGAVEAENSRAPEEARPTVAEK